MRQSKSSRPSFTFVASQPVIRRRTHRSIVNRNRPPCTASFSMSGPDTPEPLLPQPSVPKTPMDPTLGKETAVDAVSLSEAIVETTWLDSVLSSRTTLSAGNPMHPIRHAADHRIGSLSLPSRKQESWRFTDLKTMYASRYMPAIVPHEAQLASLDVRQYAPDTAGIVLVFVDGAFDKERSMLADESGKEWLSAGGYFGSITEYNGDLNRVQEMLQRKEIGPDDGGLFPTVGNALASDAVILDVPANFAVSRPVAVVFVSSGGPTRERATAHSTRLIVVTGSGSKITLLESHASLDESTFSLTLAGSAFEIGQNTSVKHYVVNDCGEDAHFVSNIHAQVQQGGRYEVRPFGVGSKVGRFTIGIDLDAKESHGEIQCAVMATGYQVCDLHSRISHNAPHATSKQLQKNIAADHGRAIFNGKIIVSENGAGTDSDQLCKSLLLSEKAAVDAMPVLEISNDDVKCTHGATVSDLEEDQLFYCQSRGLSVRDAQFLLLSGFALDVVGDCPFPTVAGRVSQKVTEIAVTSLKREGSGVEFTSI